MARKADPEKKVVADNRKARFSYSIEDTLEAGLMLYGSEVKSLRNGHATIAESYAHAKDGEIVLVNSYIPEYLPGEPSEPRAAPAAKAVGAQARSQQARHRRAARRHDAGAAQALFNLKGIAKIELGLAKGKKIHDKRETEKKRDWQRDKARLMRNKG